MQVWECIFTCDFYFPTSLTVHKLSRFYHKQIIRALFYMKPLLQMEFKENDSFDEIGGGGREREGKRERQGKRNGGKAATI